MEALIELLYSYFARHPEARMVMDVLPHRQRKTAPSTSACAPTPLRMAAYTSPMKTDGP